MSSTASTAADIISMKVIKQARSRLEPQILNLGNQIISTTIYPTQFKLTKVIPIPKSPKDPATISGWCPINIVPAVSKLAKKVITRQMLKHLTDNNLINQKTIMDLSVNI